MSVSLGAGNGKFARIFFVAQFLTAPRFEPRILAAARKISISKKRCLFFLGAGNEIRTRDIHLGKVTLYH